MSVSISLRQEAAFQIGACLSSPGVSLNSLRRRGLELSEQIEERKANPMNKLALPDFACFLVTNDLFTALDSLCSVEL